jgi:hypothetical protein
MCGKQKEYNSTGKLIIKHLTINYDAWWYNWVPPF